MSILQHAFHVVDLGQLDASCPKLVPLPRKVATELTLPAVLAPVCTSDIAVGFSDIVYAADASLSKGAIVQVFAWEVG